MRTVLIAEDEQTAREGLSEMLANAGFSVTAVADGQEALERMNAFDFDLLLLDLWMPRLSGLQLLAQLQASRRHPRVVVMTADDTPETVLMTLRGNAHRFLAKPIRMDELLQVLEDVQSAPAEAATVVVLSARPGWVELLVPCVRDVADRLPDFIMRLDADLGPEVRQTMGLVFRELLLDVMDRNEMDTNRKLRVSYLRARRMLLYRIASAGHGFRLEDGCSIAAGNGASRQVDRRDRGTAAVPDLRVHPGMLLARAEADEFLINEAMDELVVVKYLEGPQAGNGAGVAHRAADSTSRA